MRPDLDGGFTNLERRLRNRVTAFFEDEHPQRRRLQPKLPRQAQTGKTAPGDDRVVVGLQPIARPFIGPSARGLTVRG